MILIYNSYRRKEYTDKGTYGKTCGDQIATMLKEKIISS
jgi:hypothetical protein